MSPDKSRYLRMPSGGNLSWCSTNRCDWMASQDVVILHAPSTGCGIHGEMGCFGLATRLMSHGPDARRPRPKYAYVGCGLTRVPSFSQSPRLAESLQRFDSVCFKSKPRAGFAPDTLNQLRTAFWVFSPMAARH